MANSSGLAWPGLVWPGLLRGSLWPSVGANTILAAVASLFIGMKIYQKCIMHLYLLYVNTKIMCLTFDPAQTTMWPHVATSLGLIMKLSSAPLQHGSGSDSDSGSGLSLSFVGARQAACHCLWPDHSRHGRRGAAGGRREVRLAKPRLGYLVFCILTQIKRGPQSILDTRHLNARL